MSDNDALLFTSFWLSMFFLIMAFVSSLLCLECLHPFDVFLITVLCILCSHVLAINLTIKLTKIKKDNKK